jgi:hypothetical protein
MNLMMLYLGSGREGLDVPHILSGIGCLPREVIGIGSVGLDPSIR